MKSRIAVVFGGRSGEHDVSVRSAKAVIENIDKSKYSVIPIAIDHSGHWLDPKESARLLPAATTELIASDVSEMSDAAVALIGDPKYRGMIEIDEAVCVRVGEGGEDDAFEECEDRDGGGEGKRERAGCGDGE